MPVVKHPLLLLAMVRALTVCSLGASKNSMGPRLRRYEQFRSILTGVVEPNSYSTAVCKAV